MSKWLWEPVKYYFEDKFQNGGSQGSPVHFHSGSRNPTTGKAAEQTEFLRYSLNGIENKVKVERLSLPMLAKAHL